MTTTSFQVPEVARPSPETVFAELLADVLRVERLSVDSHFFDELGADSLVMAKFCARVRKQGDLPSVSIKDIYRHPTIRSLAADRRMPVDVLDGYRRQVPLLPHSRAELGHQGHLPASDDPKPGRGSSDAGR